MTDAVKLVLVVVGDAPPLRAAFRTIDHHIDQRLAHAHLPAAA
jgi:hypothetical protein